jgi:hypothetical protein
MAGKRWDLALELLRDGKPVVVADVVLRLSRPRLVTATARSAWSDPDRIDAADALEDLRRAESVLSEVRRVSPSFRELIAGRDIELEVVVDYSTGSLLVARSRDGGDAFWADASPLSEAS